MEPGVNPNTPMREIVIKNKAWICSDGETWHATRPDDRLIYNWVHVPIMADRKLPPFEKVGSEQRNGQTLLHVRLKVPEKNINPKSCRNIGSSSILRDKPNTSGTPRCRCSRKRARKSCIARLIMRRLKKRSRRHRSGHQSMTRRMALTTLNNTSSIGKVESLGSR